MLGFGFISCLPCKQGCGAVPSIQSLCKVTNVSLGPIPGISGLQGGNVYTAPDTHDADTRGLTVEVSIWAFLGLQKFPYLGRDEGKGPLPTLC